MNGLHSSALETLAASGSSHGARGPSLTPSLKNVLSGPLDADLQATAGPATGDSVAQAGPDGFCLQGI